MKDSLPLGYPPKLPLSKAVAYFKQPYRKKCKKKADCDYAFAVGN